MNKATVVSTKLSLFHSTVYNTLMATISTASAAEAVSSSTGTMASTTADSTLTSSSTTSNLALGILSYIYKPATILLVGLVSVGIGMLYKHQDKLLYFPSIQGLPRKTSDNPEGYRSPSELGNYHYETHYILNKKDGGVTTHSWLIFPKHHTQDGSDSAARSNFRPTIIFFHGNAGNIGLRLPNALQMCDVLNVNVLLVEYRGYGNSPENNTKGRFVVPSEQGIKSDAEVLWDYVHDNLSDKIDTTQLFVFGRSLGGAVAFHLAKYAASTNKPPLRGLMVENTFLSISDMVDQLMPFLTPIKPLVLRLDWNSLNIAQMLSQTSILYLAGEKDELVPPSHMKRLHKASKDISTSVIEWHSVPNGTHNDTFMRGGMKYWKAMKEFMEKSLQQNSGEGSTFSRGTIPDDEAKTDTPADARSIPIMPGNFIGIAKEAAATGDTSDKTQSKKEL